MRYIFPILLPGLVIGVKHSSDAMTSVTEVTCLDLISARVVHISFTELKKQLKKLKGNGFARICKCYANGNHLQRWQWGCDLFPQRRTCSWRSHKGKGKKKESFQKIKQIFNQSYSTRPWFRFQTLFRIPIPIQRPPPSQYYHPTLNLILPAPPTLSLSYQRRFAN